MNKPEDPRIAIIFDLISSLKTEGIDTDDILSAPGDEIDKIIYGLKKVASVQPILDKTSEISRTGTWELDLITSELVWSEITKIIHEVNLDYLPNLKTGIDFYVEGYSRDTITHLVNRAIEHGEQYDVELQIITAKKNIKHVRAIGIPEKKDGKVVRLLGMFQDLTEQEKAKIEAQRLASIVQFSTDLVGIAEMNTSVTFINEAGKEMLGVESEEQYRSTTMLDYFDDEGLKMMKEKVIPHVLKHGSWVGEVNLQHYVTNKQIPVSLNLFLIYNANGEPINFATLTRDISKEKEIRDKLIYNENSLKEAQKIGKVGSWELDLVNNKLYWSEEVYRILGLEIFSIDADYEIFLSYIHPDDRDMVNEAFSNHIENRVEYNIAHRMVMKNGDIKYVQERCETEWNSNGAPIRSIGTVSDITEQKIIEIELENYKNNLKQLVEERTQELEQANEELKQAASEIKRAYDEQSDLFEKLKSTQSQLIQSEKMASLGVLTAGIAHEINNPINFVYAGVNSLEENLKDVKKVLEAYNNVNESNVIEKLNEIREMKSVLQFDKLLDLVDRLTLNIKNGAERTTEIIKGLKTFSREDNDKFTRVNIHDSLEDALLLLNSQITENITVKKQYGKTPEIDCYSSKINQVFINIIGNALQSVDTKGVIVISTSQVTRKKKEYVKVAIKDSGTGMSKDIQNRIFEPFYTTKEVGKGTGLGLSICHNIIKNHNGFIEVDSKLGKGTTMNIFLPVKQ